MTYENLILLKDCYVDEDCPARQVCKAGSCQQRLPLIQDIINVEPDHCYTDAHCPPGHKCGLYKKCYDMSNSTYVVESFMNIPCKHEARDFCAKATGFENAMCREIYFENEGVRSYICQLPPPFAWAELKSCGGNNSCSRYSTCIRGTCFHPFWVTVKERCRSNRDCTFRSRCTRSGCKQRSWALQHKTCRVSSQCNSGELMKFVCRRFECTYRRNVPLECDACRFDEFCDLYENCRKVQRFTEFNCDGDNWFYWYSAFYCLSTAEKTYKGAISACEELKAELVYPPDRGDMTNFSPENALLSYLAIRAGWVPDGTDGVEKTFVDWRNVSERTDKSRFFCKRQKCQTSFVYRHDHCYITGFTNFMPRFAIRTICTLLDSEIVSIKNKEEAQTAYDKSLTFQGDKMLNNFAGLSGGKSFWLGLRKGRRYWYWEASTYGDRAHFFNWRAGQPDITDGKFCAYAAQAGEWVTADCNNFRMPRIFICQSPSYNN
ncbi:unnamed protein product [Litomosoides sigmodontis]|uniref:C-type lectin domain-containing protein n=1 Tax=Litomosoides sigmodontis TaxID=42156 RepID=A0A3P6V5H6_LITSI|nr:unnamed protein product [Litomosoides sigmodontis]